MHLDNRMNSPSRFMATSFQPDHLSHLPHLPRYPSHAISPFAYSQISPYYDSFPLGPTSAPPQADPMFGDPPSPDMYAASPSDWQIMGMSLPYEPVPPISEDLSKELALASEIKFGFEVSRSRYFILKPVGKGTIRKAIRSNSYSLQANVAAKLNLSFVTSSAVILICSALNSHSFQAAARVMGPIQIQQDKKRAMAEVEWLTGFTYVAFSEVEHLKNRFKGNVRVTESQDGQEVSHHQGIAITQLLAFRSMDQNHSSSPPSYPGAPAPALAGRYDANPVPLLPIETPFFYPAFPPFILHDHSHPSARSAPHSPPSEHDTQFSTVLRSGSMVSLSDEAPHSPSSVSTRVGGSTSLDALPSPPENFTFDCSNCKAMGNSDVVQYFPCRDILCRECITQLNGLFPKKSSSSCPRCRQRMAAPQIETRLLFLHRP